MENIEKDLRQFAFNQKYYGSNERRMRWEEFQMNQNNEKEVGKYIFAEAKEDNTTRLFIKRLSIASNITTKEGWWDTFTITNKSCAQGIWLCKIEKFSQDKDGYMICIVEPIKNFGQSINEESIAWDYFYQTGDFSYQYVFQHHKLRFNTQEVEKRCSSFLDLTVPDEEKYIRTIPRLIFNAFLEDKVALEYIEDCLDTPQGFEALAIDIKKNGAEYAQKYPLMMNKIKKLNPNGYVYIDEIQSYISRKYYEFDSLKREEKITSELEEWQIFERIETVVQYWEDVKKAEKLAKKEARKAKKANKQ